MSRKVVITGRGVITSIGAGLAENTESLKSTKNGISLVDSFCNEGLDSQVSGKINYEFNCPLFERKTLRFMPENARMAVYAAYEAIHEAGYTMETLPGNEMAVLMGTAGSAYGELCDSIEKFKEVRSTRRVTPFSVPRIMPSSSVASLSLLFHITGESYDISCACTSSAIAIMLGARMILSGEYDIVMVGGSEEVSWQQALGFNCMKALSHNYNATPERASRPFDKDRDGFVIAEGAGVLILESEEHAKARNAKILCELSGFASNSNATDMVAPDAPASAAVMKMALAKAGLQPSDIAYINTHGTSTGVGDPVELTAIGDVFGKDGRVLLNSTKSQIGHTIGAAGAIEAVYTTLMMEHGFVSKSANLENVEPGFEWANIARETLYNVEIEHAISNNFGFGGTNATLVFSKYKG